MALKIIPTEAESGIRTVTDLMEKTIHFRATSKTCSMCGDLCI
ncbi:MAG: hypothetical protein ACE5J3_05660 [Methanosarcinales archaeon]